MINGNVGNIMVPPDWQTPHDKTMEAASTVIASAMANNAHTYIMIDN